MGRCEMGDLRKATLAFFDILHLGQYVKNNLLENKCGPG